MLNGSYAAAAAMTLFTAAGADGSTAESLPYLLPPPPVAQAQPEYPQHSLRLDEQGVVLASFWIEKSGQTSQCAIVKSSGYPRLDEATCVAISKMTFGSFQEGAVGPFLKQVRWKFEDRWAANEKLLAIPHETRGINVTRPGELPEGRRSNVGVYLSVSKEGLVIGCKVRWGSENPDLDKRACEIASQWRYQSYPKNNRNKPETAIETVFFADQSAPSDDGRVPP